MISPEPALFGNALINWYRQHKRPLPWRETRDPYAIWLSEVILQQTRVNQGLPYYQTFLSNYPTIKDLAQATEDEVLRHWQGLGYYSRARNMHHTAKYISFELDGKFPGTYAELLKLKGIGPYTAAAIASFAFKEPVAVLDGNVFRVLARVYGLADDISSPAGKKAFQLLADSLIYRAEPDTYNQAIMEFGAIQCTPVMPDCLFCPLQQTCFAFLNGLVAALPHKSKAKAGRKRYFHYLVLQWQDKYYLRKRTQTDIWQGLYDFYLQETDSPDLPDEILLQELKLLAPAETKPVIKGVSEVYKHVLTHQKIYAKFYLIGLHARLREEVTESTGLSLLSASEIEQLPKAIMIDRYLKATVF
ncbi:A/G-specific adenine glycosylase [Adhaeribacter aerolatus]|uniref:Adenine DNA glycosylase n=1 Tax=Adhaeribacter aerolatus TaxID=670289 RepID=A0A512ATC8_9BACT|nr:A/G-specific adenine glycosylase [Adhaeribacter aerolatus]GEO02969.1 A/G-specific adenine glycosylase [Adhaeribacter aerolatus]